MTTMNILAQEGIMDLLTNPHLPPSMYIHARSKLLCTFSLFQTGPGMCV